MEELLKMLGQSGPFGVITALSIWVAWKKDQQLKALYENTLSRSEQMLDRYHVAIEALNDSVRSIVDYEKHRGD